MCVELVIMWVGFHVSGAGDQVGVVMWVEQVISWVRSYVRGAGDQMGVVFCAWSW